MTNLSETKLSLNFKLLYTRNNCSNDSQYSAIICVGRLLGFERAFGLTGLAHWPFVCIVSGLFMIFWENNEALKLE